MNKKWKQNFHKYVLNRYYTKSLFNIVRTIFCNNKIKVANVVLK